MTQPQLFTDYGQPRTRSRKALAKLVRKRCATEGCTNWARMVQGAKYCEEHATCIDYNLTGQVPDSVTATTCVICHQPCTAHRRMGTTHRPPVCRDHQHLGQMLWRWRRRYNMTDEQMRDLIDDAVCWVCGDSLAWRFHNLAKPEQDTVHVDHNHLCCRSETSCGNCIRGLAHQSCNLMIGQVERLAVRVGKDRVIYLLDRLAVTADTPGVTGPGTAGD